MFNLKVRARLLVTFLIIGLLPTLVISLLALQQGTETLTEQGIGQLESIRELKKAHIVNFYAERKQNLNQLLNVVEMLKREAFAKLQGVRSNKEAQVASYFKERFNDIRVMSKSNSIAQALSQFDGAFQVNQGQASGMAWDATVERFGDELTQYRDEQGYADLLLVSAQGNVIYTVNRGADLGGNVLTGSLKDTALATVFKKGLADIHMEDYAPYAPFDDEPSAFLAAPIRRFNEAIGVLVLRLSLNPIQNIARNREGLGRTGSVYFINALARVIGLEGNRAAENPELGVVGEMDQRAILKEIQAETSGTRIVKNGSGVLKLVSYAPMVTSFFQWAVVVEMSLEEVINPAGETGKTDFLSGFVANSGYSDVFLIHPEGRIFFTMKHGPDYGTNILHGPYGGSELGGLVKSVLRSKAFGMSDVAPYGPADGKPSGFIAQPLMSGENVVLIVALRMADTLLNTIMGQRDGMGETGETYLVGADKLMRSNSLLDPERYSVLASFAQPDDRRIDTPGVRAAMSGETGTQWSANYRGDPVLSSYTPLEIGQHTWTLIAETSRQEMFAPITELRLIFLLVGVLVAVLVIVAGWWSSRAITGPLDDIAMSVLTSSTEMAATTSQQERITNLQTTAVMDSVKTIKNLETSARLSAEQAASAEENAANVAGMARQGREQMMELQTSMTAAEERVEAIAQQIQTLSETTARIGEVTNMMKDFASETKMLAMNAAVEAVRAGEQGKGFSVLSVEIRKLADESKRSAERIDNLVAEMQAVTNTTVMVTEEGTNTMQHGGRIAKTTHTTFNEVMGSVDSVSDSTKQISLNVQQQVTALRQSLESMNSLESGARETVLGISQVKTGIEVLNDAARSLKEMM